ncbi:MAG: hypothetical protein PHR44_02110 [Candidatus Omnitrophica bacterium]|nr:hypothetical protein [Candidatus Omnitrophota bacterium]
MRSFLITFISTIAAIITVYASWNAIKYSLIIIPNNLTINNSEWNEIYHLMLTNNKDYPLFAIQIHITCEDNTFDVDNIELIGKQEGDEVLNLGDKDNYYTVNYNLVQFTAVSKPDRIKTRILRVNSLEPHTTKRLPIKIISNQTQKMSTIRIKIGEFFKTPQKVTEKKNEVAIPFVLNKEKLWMRLSLDKK